MHFEGICVLKQELNYPFKWELSSAFEHIFLCISMGKQYRRWIEKKCSENTWAAEEEYRQHESTPTSGPCCIQRIIDGNTSVTPTTPTPDRLQTNYKSNNHL